MAGLMADMDLAIAAFGVSAYELAAIGVPTLYICHNPSDVTAVQALETAGESLGEQSEVDTAQLRAKVLELIGNREERRDMSASGTALGLGDGARNVAREIAEAGRRADQA